MVNTRDRANRVNQFLTDYQPIFDIYERNEFLQLDGMIESFIETSIDDIVFSIVIRDSVLLKSFEVPIFSSFDDCCLNMCIVLDSLDNKGVEMIELGELLLQKKAKGSALYKYGESHFKTAQILGIACKGKEKGAMKAYMTNIGYYYLTKESQRNRLMSRLILRSKIAQKLLKESFDKTYNVYECMNMLSTKTINRRLPNVKKVFQELLNSNEFDFSNYINNLRYDPVETKE